MRTLAAFCVFLLVTACQAPPPEMTEAEMAQAEAAAKQAINDRWAAYWSAAQSRDMDELMSLWAPDARILEPGMDLQGSELHEFMRSFWEGGGQVSSFDIRSLEIFVHGGVAYQIAQYDESYQLPGGEPAEGRGNMFIRWVREPDGAWRISRMVVGARDAVPEGQP